MSVSDASASTETTGRVSRTVNARSTSQELAPRIGAGLQVIASQIRTMPVVARCEGTAVIGSRTALQGNPRDGALERMGLASVVVARLDDDDVVPVGRVDQPVDAGNNLAIIARRAEVGQAVIGERDPHSTMSARSAALPSDASATPLSSRSAFAGDRIR